mmetsp:Transcript_23866/g.61488  ORF Transcript_23866/g.61488 Transcript_23866/m.61488 type:complete len:103 (-) Transcript_23866:175-483(-)
MVVALSGGELIYFELDALNNIVETNKKDLGQEIACLDIGAVPPNRQRCRFLCVGSWDNSPWWTACRFWTSPSRGCPRRSSRARFSKRMPPACGTAGRCSPSV